MEDARRPERDRGREREKDPVAIDRRGELTTANEERAERRVRDDGDGQDEGDPETPAHVRFHRCRHPRIGHVVAHRLVAAVRLGLSRGVMHRLVRADFRLGQGDRIAEVALSNLLPQRCRIGRPGVHGDPRELAGQIDRCVDNMRELADRARQVVLAARAKHVVERDLEHVYIGPRFGRCVNRLTRHVSPSRA